jgi:hypothetical protein
MWFNFSRFYLQWKWGRQKQKSPTRGPLDAASVKLPLKLKLALVQNCLIQALFTRPRFRHVFLVE